MKRQKLSTEVRQEQIVHAAMNLIARQGLKGLSMAAISSRIGLVPSAIYRHFRSKDDVIEMILDFIQDRLFSNVERVCKDVSDPIERLQCILKRHVQLIRDNKAIPRLLFSEEVFSGNSKRKNKVYGIITGYLKSLEKIVHEGQKRGQIRPDLRSNTLALMFFGMIQPVVILWFLSDGRFDITKHSESNWEVFREAILFR